MRKLATAATAFCAAIFAANYILPLGRLTTLAVIAAVLGAALAASRKMRLRQAALARLCFWRLDCFITLPIMNALRHRRSSIQVKLLWSAAMC